MKPGSGKEVEAVKSRETNFGGTLWDCRKRRPMLAMANENVITFRKCYRSGHCVSILQDNLNNNNNNPSEI